MGLAVLGFATMVAAEFTPWGHIQVATDSSRSRDRNFVPGSDVGLEQIQASQTYHLAAIALLAAIGFVLAGAAVRRRVAMGVALGLAAGQALVIVSLVKAINTAFDSSSYSGLNMALVNPPGAYDSSSSSMVNMVVGPGVYLAASGVLLLAAAAITGVLPPGGWRRRLAPVPAAHRSVDSDPVEQLDGERELTVTALEPVDERYFARPEP
jgi:hypothetical protein